MKKIIILLSMALFLFAVHCSASNFVVTQAPSSEMNGTYVETGEFNGKPLYIYAPYYCISWGGASWQIGMGSGFIDFVTCSSTSTSQTCATDGWDCPGMIVAPETDGLDYSSTQLIESLSNDGSLTEPITIRLTRISVGQDFTGVNGNDYAGTKIIFGSLPAGLTPHAIKNDTSLTLTFTGAANNNNHADETYITLQFTDAAFALGTAADVRNHLDSIHILFREQLTVASTGADFTTIAGAIATAADHDIISLAAETFTEAGLTVDKAVVFKGQGADQTIIQADVTPNTASARVFTVAFAGNVVTDTVEFRDLSIRHGRSVGGNGYGGGIWANHTPINIYNCAITDNVAYSTGGGTSTGGGIFCVQPLKIMSSLISGNTSQSVTGYGYAGGLSCYNLLLVNSTITGNLCAGGTTPNLGGGLLIQGQGKMTIINSTIVNNTSADGGSAIAAFGDPTLTLINTIAYGNTGGDDVQLFSTSGHTVFNASDCIIGASSTAIINGTNYNVSTADPALYPLADNGGTTFTMALSAGSFAINEGATGDSIPTTDQRGYIENGIRDIGAFEYDALITAAKPLPAAPATVVYPNPATDFITVAGCPVNSTYTIADVLGKTVLTGTITSKNTVINTASLSTGIYILKAGMQQYKLVKE